MLKRCISRYRALERLDNGELLPGFEENDTRDPKVFRSREVTYYDDSVYRCYEETNKARLKDQLKDKKRKEDEKDNFDIIRSD